MFLVSKRESLLTSTRWSWWPSVSGFLSRQDFHHLWCSAMKLDDVIKDRSIFSITKEQPAPIKRSIKSKSPLCFRDARLDYTSRSEGHNIEAGYSVLSAPKPYVHKSNASTDISEAIDLPRKHIPWERLKVNLPHGVIVRAERRGAVGLSSRYWRGLNFPIKVTGL